MTRTQYLEFMKHQSTIRLKSLRAKIKDLKVSLAYEVRYMEQTLEELEELESKDND